MDNTEKAPVHVVGIGASAGGLEAIESFFKNMPDNSGVAFVVIQHLSPDHKSLMAELLSKRTLMPVYRAEDGMGVEKDCVYLIPPNKNLRIFHGKLLLSEQNRDDRGINLPIDIFFRSLAEDFGDKAIAVVLSGTGSDGTSGIRAIKENLGMVMAQAEETAAFDGMPRSAIATGLVDYILAPDAMPAQLLSYLKHPYTSKDERSSVLLSNEDGLSRIFALLRERNKIDFTYYKPSTIIRRIERRMAVNQIQDLSDYVRFLESYASELDSLNRDLLIGVTSFFRDPEAFDALRNEHLANLLKSHNREEKLRIWVAGCSTGEEAYSLAILCLELLDQLGLKLDIKIFATDVDREAILEASTGMYPESSVANIEPPLLASYFYVKEDGYQISRQVREMVVFAQHNLIKDPPFTNIDVISCRNLLIYLQPVLQKRVLELFNFALNAQGLLFLGSSETTGEMSEYFEPLEARQRIYQSNGRRRPADLSPAAADYRMHGHAGFGRSPLRQNALQLHEEERLLERFIQGVSDDYLPFSMIVNDRLELLHVVGKSQDYLHFQSGKMINDVTKLATRDLAIPLSTGLQKVLKNQTELNYTNIHLRSSDMEQVVNMRLLPLPVKKGQAPLIAVFIEPAREPDRSVEVDIQTYDVGKEAAQRISDLENELQFTRENLQATVEELETSNEELQATNEELLASNEELQSTNEELQSVNEELYTVNSEYQGKITELTEANNDLDNLLKNTRVATLFLDENLDIRRFTPETSKLFRIMEHDIGRPLGDLSHEFVDVNIMQLVRRVQLDNQSLEQDVMARDGRCYLLRIYPYQIAPQIYTGLVLTLIDVSNLRNTQASLAKRNQVHSSLLASLTDAYVLINARGLIMETNQALESLLGYTTDEVVGQNVSMLMSGQDARQHDDHLKRYLDTGDARVIGSNRLVNARHKQGYPMALVLSVTRLDVGDEVMFAGLMRPPIEAPV